MLEQLLAEVPPGVERADVLFELASVREATIPTLIELCDEALADAGGDDARSARILAFRAWFHLLEADVQAALADARAALEKAERVGDPALLAAAIARVGQVETWAAEITPGLLERGAEIEERLGLDARVHDSPRLPRAAPDASGRDRTPSRHPRGARGGSAARGDEVTRRMSLWYLSLLEWLAGRWQLALDHANGGRRGRACDRSPRLVGRARQGADRDRPRSRRGGAGVGRGRARCGARGSNEAFRILTLGVLGRLELALGNLEAAGGYLRELPDGCSREG